MRWQVFEGMKIAFFVGWLVPMKVDEEDDGFAWVQRHHHWLRARAAAHGGLHFRVLNFGRFHFGSLICGGLTCGKIDLQEDWPAGRLHFGGLHFGRLTCGGLTCGGLICRISEKISLILRIAQNILAQNPFDACSISLQSQIISAQNLCRVQNPFNLKIPCLTIPSGYKVPSLKIPFGQNPFV